MKEVAADLWEAAISADLCVITTNGATKKGGACVMGRGCALEAKERYPGIDHKLGRLIEEHGNRVMRIGRYGEAGAKTGARANAGVMIASFPVKNHWRQEADPGLISCSAGQLAAIADKFDYRQVVMPRPGCGNGGLSWEDVRPILAEVLDERFTVVTFPK